MKHGIYLNAQGGRIYIGEPAKLLIEASQHYVFTHGEDAGDLAFCRMIEAGPVETISDQGQFLGERRTRNIVTKTSPELGEALMAASKSADLAGRTWHREYTEEMKRKMERDYSENQRRLVASKCPRCGAVGTYDLWQIHGLSYMECSACKYRNQ